MTKVSPDTQSLCVSTPGDEVSLVTLKLQVTKDLSLRALVDCGASNNFVRRQSLAGRRLKLVERDIPRTRMTVCFATGASITVEKRVVVIHNTLEGKQYDDKVIVLDLDEKFNIILGLAWLRKYEPGVSWQHRSVKIHTACSSDGHLMNVMKRPQVCRCTANEYDGLTSDTVASPTAQDLSVVDHYTVEQAPDGCTEVQAAPRVHHSIKSSGPGHGCMPSWQHPRLNEPIIQGRLESRT